MISAGTSPSFLPKCQMSTTSTNRDFWSPCPYAGNGCPSQLSLALTDSTDRTLLTYLGNAQPVTRMASHIQENVFFVFRYSVATQAQGNTIRPISFPRHP